MESYLKICRNKWVKLTLTIVFIISVITAVASLQWFLNFLDHTGSGMEAIFEDYNRSYVETSGFQTEFWSEADDILSRIAAKDLFETDGVFDNSKIVDIEQYVQKGTIDGKAESGVSYTIESLLTMDLDNAEWENIYVCQKKKKDSNGIRYVYYKKSDFMNLIKNEYNEELYSKAEEYETLEDDCGPIYNEDGARIYESCWTLEVPEMKMSPVEGDWIDIFNENPEINGKMNDYRELLEQACENLSHAYSRYTSGNRYEDAEKTNIRYILYNDKTKKLYSNNPKWNKAKKFGEYMDELKTSQICLFKDMEDSFWECVNLVEHGYSDDMDDWGYAMETWNGGFTIDPTFQSAEDTFTKQHSNYQKYAGLVKTYRMILGISLSLILLCLVFLACGLGVTEDGSLVPVNWFDHWKTEIAALVIVGCWGVFFGVGAGFITEINDLVGNYIFWAALLSIPSAVFFLLGYNSLIKRLYHHTLWENSICYILWRWMKKILLEVITILKVLFQNLNLIWKYVVVVMGVYVVHWIAFASAGNGFAIFLTLVVEIALMIVMIQTLIGQQKILDGLRDIVRGELKQKIDTSQMKGTQKEAAELLNHVEDGMQEAMEKQIRSERMKTELITNVSHDIKTPLTSIINYVDLLKRETKEFDKADPQKVEEYLEILEQKSQRLKVLTEDVVEASKISSGNISLENVKLDLVETLMQVEGEYEEKISKRELQMVKKLPEPPVTIYADGRRIWRIFGNLYQNVAKYALPNSRVYVDLEKKDNQALFTMKNISEAPLNIEADELTERFIRGDASRTTEGSGLGLSIAKSLTEAMGGNFEIYLDGDLFKITISFPICL